LIELVGASLLFATPDGLSCLGCRASAALRIETWRSVWSRHLARLSSVSMTS
jgi:hypothetical protein